MQLPLSMLLTCFLHLKTLPGGCSSFSAIFKLQKERRLWRRPLFEGCVFQGRLVFDSAGFLDSGRFGD